MNIIDLEKSSVRELNARLHGHGHGNGGGDTWQVLNPHGKHSLAVGLEAAHKVLIEGHAGYYCGGMNKAAEITVRGQCSKGLGENIMSGAIRVEGNAAEAAGASGRGGFCGGAGARA